MHCSLIYFGYILCFYSTRGYALEQWEDNSQVFVKEECSTNIFSASCDNGRLMVVQSAILGREKRDETCVRSNVGLGCRQNVFNQLDSHCSGRSRCEFEFHDHFGLKSECPNDSYVLLRVEYRCQAVYQAFGKQCNSPTSLALDVSTQPVLLSNHLTIQSDHGSAFCPWLLSADPGKLITLTLISFKRRFQDSGSDVHICFKCAKVVDGSHTQSINVCDGWNRTKQVYTSQSSSILLEMLLTEETDDIYFFMYVQAVGCANTFSVSSGLWLRVNNGATSGILQCNHTGTTWHVQCQHGEWQGYDGHCSPQGTNHYSDGRGDQYSTVEFPFGILIVVAVGVALGVFLGGLLLICFSKYMKRKQRQAGHMSDINYAPPSNYVSEAELERIRDSKHTSKYNTQALYEKTGVDTGPHCYGTVPPQHCTITRTCIGVPVYDTKDLTSPTPTLQRHTCHLPSRESL